MIFFKKVRYKNFLSTGNDFITVDLNKFHKTLIVGKNGSGKCVDKLTQIEIEIDDEETKKLFLDMISSKKKFK